MPKNENTQKESNGNNNGTTGGTGGTIVGITFSAGTANNVYKNKIYDLSSTSTNPTVSAITAAGGTTNTIYNNIIGNLSASVANAAIPVIGLNITSGTTDNIYFNTIYLNASSTGATFGSSGIYSNTAPTLSHEYSLSTTIGNSSQQKNKGFFAFGMWASRSLWSVS